MNARPTVVLAGAGGDLGGRIAKALIRRRANVRALVRPDLEPQDLERIERLGVSIARADSNDEDELATACAGAACVVSALNGVRRVMIDRQGMLLDAAVRAGVPRFIPSDYSADYTKTRPGHNRNFDLRREFATRADKAPIRVTSILNGAFMDMLGAEMPIILPHLRRVLYWGNADQLLDFTTKDDVAAYVASAAMDENTPRMLRIAGDSVSARDIAAAMSDATGTRFRTLWAGSIGTLGLMIRVAKRIAPQPEVAFPPWQGLQYMRDQFSGRAKFDRLDNQRYPDLDWTKVQMHLTARFSAAVAR